MKLYRLKALYLGKDLDDEVTIEYFLAENESAAFKYVDQHYAYWTDDIEAYENEEDEEELPNRIKKNHGDFDEEYDGEFYDIKYKWEEVGGITEEDIVVLKKFNIVKEVNNI
jgi:hypothetical protein